jgi:hypothetical protein
MIAQIDINIAHERYGFLSEIARVASHVRYTWSVDCLSEAITGYPFRLTTRVRAGSSRALPEPEPELSVVAGTAGTCRYCRKIPTLWGTIYTLTIIRDV